MGGKRLIYVILLVSSLLSAVFNPAFSADAEAAAGSQTSNYVKKIMYIFEDSRNLYQIGLMGFEGEKKNILTREGNNWCPVISPSGEKIAFFSDRSGFNNLWVMNSDGSSQTQLTFNKENINKIDLMCRGQIAWLKANVDNFESIYFLKLGDIWSIDTNGVTPSCLTNYHDVTAFMISPPSENIRFLYSREKTKNHNGLWSMKLDGTEIKQVHSSVLVFPVFDWGDKETIAFFNNRGISVVLYTGLEKKNIKETLYLNNEIAWEKTNLDKSQNKIAFISDKNKGPNIWVMNPDGTAESQITYNGGISPYWGPDGQSLIFVEGNDIFSTNLRTKEKIRLTYNFSAYFPAVVEIKTKAEPAAATENK